MNVIALVNESPARKQRFPVPDLVLWPAERTKRMPGAIHDFNWILLAFSGKV